MTRSLLELLVGFAIFVVAGLFEGGYRLDVWGPPVATAPHRRSRAGAATTGRLRSYLALVRSRTAPEPPALSR